MNNRIKELANKAGYSKDYLEIGLPSNMKKFAQLIVEECLYIVEGEDDGSADTKSVRLAMIRMKQHFGVEE